MTDLVDRRESAIESFREAIERQGYIDGRVMGRVSLGGGSSDSSLVDNLVALSNALPSKRWSEALNQFDMSLSSLAAFAMSRQNLIFNLYRLE